MVDDLSDSIHFYPLVVHLTDVSLSLSVYHLHQQSDLFLNLVLPGLASIIQAIKRGLGFSHMAVPYLQWY